MEIRHQRPSWLGHVLRAKSIANDVTNQTPRGKRDRNRDGLTKVKKKKQPRQLGTENIDEATLNRDGWKEVCFEAVIPPP